MHLTRIGSALAAIAMLVVSAACSDSTSNNPVTATAQVTGGTAKPELTRAVVLPFISGGGSSSPAASATAAVAAAAATISTTPLASPTSQPSPTPGPTQTPYPTPTPAASPTPLPTLTPRPPGVEITSPSSFGPLRARTPIYFAANAMSPQGLQRVELYIDNQLVTTQDAKGATEFNLVYGWQTDVNGDYHIQAKAVDASGQVLQSPVVIQPVRGGVDAVVNGTAVVSAISSTVYIPEGTFQMGNNNGPDEEKPQHDVHLSAYEIDRFEVTVGQFRDFVNASQRKTSAEGDHQPITRTWHIDDAPDRWENPVRFVSWWDADAYCHWVGKRLPTEAEWEYAARGNDLRQYPWGNDFDAARVPSGDTSPVGFHTSGVSPFGLYDMAGNVWEWTDDWFDPLYYKSSDPNNPHPPKNSDQKTIRGGGFNSSPDDLRVTRRIHNFPTTYHPDVGFRCVKPQSSP